ncbi:MAG: NAD(P)-dependent oxidoreductase [Candidatus Omnitrophota bacterium]
MAQERLKGRKVLVTGASGFLGRHLVQAFLKEGGEVWALEHNRPFPDHLRSDKLHIVKADLADLESLRPFLDNIHAVCHLAAYIPVHYEDSSCAEQCFRINSLLTLRFAEMVSRRKEIRFINFSTGAIYAYSELPVSEEDLLYPVAKATYYAASKLLGELYVERLRLLESFPAITIRLASCYGLGMPEDSSVGRFMQRALAGEPLEVWDGGAARYDFVSVSDAVKATLAALESDGYGVYNVGSGGGHSILELAQTIAEIFGSRNVQIEVKPFSGKPLKGLPVLSIQKARDKWDYRPRSLKAGLLEYQRGLLTDVHLEPRSPKR